MQMRYELERRRQSVVHTRVSGATRELTFSYFPDSVPSAFLCDIERALALFQVYSCQRLLDCGVRTSLFFLALSRSAAPDPSRSREIRANCYVRHTGYIVLFSRQIIIPLSLQPLAPGCLILRIQPKRLHYPVNNQIYTPNPQE